MTRSAAVAAALAMGLPACGHTVAPPARIRSTGSSPAADRVRAGAIDVRPAAGRFSTGPSKEEREAALASASRRGAGDAAGPTAHAAGDLCMQAVGATNEPAALLIVGTFVCGVAFLTVPIAAISGAAAGRHEAAEWLPADVPELQPGVADALAAWSEAGAPSAVLAKELAAAGEGSGFELRAAPESGTTDTGMDVSVDGGGLEWAGDGSRLALFVDVWARLDSGAVPSWAFLRVRDAESYAPAQWKAGPPRRIVDERMPVLLRRTAAVVLHEVLLRLDGPDGRSTYGDAVCDLGPMTPDGEPVELTIPVAVPRAPDGRIRLAWEPWRAVHATGPVAYDLRIYPEDGDEPVVSANDLKTNSVLVGGLEPSRPYRFTVRAVTAVEGKRLVSRWWRRAEGTPCSSLDAVEPPRASLFPFRTPRAPRGAEGSR